MEPRSDRQPTPHNSVLSPEVENALGRNAAGQQVRQRALDSLSRHVVPSYTVNNLDELDDVVARLELRMGRRFGAPEDPLFLSIVGGRPLPSGRLRSLLFVGLNSDNVVGLGRMTTEAFAVASFRRYAAAYGNLVLGLRPDAFVVDSVVAASDIIEMTSGSVVHQREACAKHLEAIAASVQGGLPQAPHAQLQRAVDVFLAPSSTILLQAMVFGVTPSSSGAGIAVGDAVQPDPSQPRVHFRASTSGFGLNPRRPSKANTSEFRQDFPEAYEQLESIVLAFATVRLPCEVLFTIERERLWVHDVRPVSTVLVSDGHAGLLIASGIAASPGLADGRLCLSSEAVMDAKATGEPAILVLDKPVPADLSGAEFAAGIATKTGDLLSHAAVVARACGVPGAVGLAELQIEDGRLAHRSGYSIPEGALVRIDGSVGELYEL